ncbi:GntR family transcriptional regulator [Tateyamaria pelophila]|uniref:GntR family transcriptional regulator n=1 Tax=Tateyamaria pelophila TaxID=328415 RepID=UPI001CBF99A7|nr:GntR family transcriptional regulator [Tateyamaria pelophila]
MHQMSEVERRLTMSSALDDLSRINLGDQVYERIAKALLTGQMRPNDKLTIRGLSERWGVSTTPIRDAIKQLTQEKVLEQRSPKDVRVPVMTQAMYLEILQIRLHLEGLAAERAAERATPQDLRDLRKLLNRNDKAADRQNLALATAGNQEFHLSLSAVADMPTLQKILKGLWLQMGPLVACYYDMQPPGLNALHHEVIDAMQDKSPDRARLAIQKDILSAKPALLDQITTLRTGLRDPAEAL